MGTGTKCIGQSKMRKNGKPWCLNNTCLGNFESWCVLAFALLLGQRSRITKVANLATDCHSSWKDGTHLKNENKLEAKATKNMFFVVAISGFAFFFIFLLKYS